MLQFLDPPKNKVKLEWVSSSPDGAVFDTRSVRWGVKSNGYEGWVAYPNSVLGDTSSVATLEGKLVVSLDRWIAAGCPKFLYMEGPSFFYPEP